MSFQEEVPENKLAKLEDYQGNISQFMKHLLSKSPRVRLHTFYDDLHENKGFFITRQCIHFPYVIPKLEHEIAHLVELNTPKRWVLSDWGMKNFCDEEKVSNRAMFAGFAREVRVRAIQIQMTTSLSEKIVDFIAEKNTLYNILNNSFWKDSLCRRLPFGKFKTEQDLQLFVAETRDRILGQWSKDRIEMEYQVRLDYIHNYMDTNHAS